MVKILRYCICIMLLTPNIIFAATWYISPTGNDTAGDGSSGNRWATFSKAFSEMSGGDTLIAGDGTYTGDLNMWSQTSLPPSGSSTSWTTIKAENTTEAIIDGEGVRNPVSIQYTDFSANDLYIDIDGITFQNASGTVGLFNSVQHVKLRNCVGINAGTGNTGIFTFSRGCSYILMENCMAFGAGRGMFSVYQSSKSIVRSCIGRIDRVECGDPLQAIAMYSVDDCAVQNCIIIDSDQKKHYFNSGNDYAGSMVIPCTDMDSNRVTFDNCLSINNDIGGLSISGKDSYQSKNCTIKNSVWCDITQDNGSPLYTLRGNSSTITNCTFAMGYSSSAFFVSSDEGFGYNTILKNNIIFNQRQLNSTPDIYLFSRIDTSNYNALYGYNLPTSVFTNGSGTVGVLGANDITTTDPLYRSTNTTGGLRYLPRIESGSNLSGAGESGADIGANILTLIGSTGTLWGETGYNTDTGISMWPFPNEDLIKEKMNAYSYTDATGTVSGNRGFASTSTTSMDGSPMTLTKYIWEYLGNQIPADIYNSTPTAYLTVVSTSGYNPLSVQWTCVLTGNTESPSLMTIYWSDGTSVGSIPESTTMTGNRNHSSSGSFYVVWKFPTESDVTSNTVYFSVSEAPVAPPPTTYTTTISGGYSITGSCVMQN